MPAHTFAPPKASAMTKSVFSHILLAAALVCGLHAVPAHAQANRTFISGAGSDANLCTFTSPCRNAQRAHDVTNSGGEINVLDPAGYGSLTITKAISIQGHGWGELVGAGGATAITIAAASTDRINLRGLVIEGFGTGNAGIVFNTAASLNIQDSIIRNFTTYGIDFAPTAASVLNVSRTVVSDIGRGGTAVFVNPTGSGAANAALDHVELDRSSAGLAVTGDNTTGSINVTMANSIVSNFTGNGIGFTGPALGMIQNCTVSNNGLAGIQTSGNFGEVAVTRSTITGNGVGLSFTGGSNLISFGDNSVSLNSIGDGAAKVIIGYH
jgi:hypothetical protein